MFYLNMVDSLSLSTWICFTLGVRLRTPVTEGYLTWGFYLNHVLPTSWELEGGGVGGP